MLDEQEPENIEEHRSCERDRGGIRSSCPGAQLRNSERDPITGEELTGVSPGTGSADANAALRQIAYEGRF
jgi:hypothetical protein